VLQPRCALTTVVDPLQDATGETRCIKSVEDANALILDCARYALLDRRRAALESLRNGFLGQSLTASASSGENAKELDISHFIALFTPRETALLVGGRDTRLSPSELLALINFPTNEQAHDMWGTDKPPQLLRSWIESFDDDDERCNDLFRCITGRRAVPVHGRLSIELAAAKDSDGRTYDGRAAAEASTCFNTLRLAQYETAEQLAEGMGHLLRSKAHFNAT
jgi:hypothetical protein